MVKWHEVFHRLARNFAPIDASTENTKGQTHCSSSFRVTTENETLSQTYTLLNFTFMTLALYSLSPRALESSFPLLQLTLTSIMFLQHRTASYCGNFSVPSTQNAHSLHTKYISGSFHHSSSSSLKCLLFSETFPGLF